MIDTQAIRKKILDLALQGKLTEQLPEDGMAELQYQQIQPAIQVSIKIENSDRKQLSVLSEKETLFDIPITWIWVHIGDLFSHNTGKALKKSDTTGRKLTYITTSNVYWDRFELNSLKTMHFQDDEIEKCTVKKGDLLVCEGGDIGRSAIWPFDSEIRIQNHIHKLRKRNKNVHTKFYYYVMLNYKYNNLIRGQGIGLEGFSSKRLHNLVVPFPPFDEQARIVDRIDSAFEVLKQLDTLQGQYQDNLATLKNKIIDAGIQGQLTEQLPEDGTAEELYQQIQQEKLALEKAGKIKKSKPLSSISEEEKLFDLPDNWKWVRFADLMLSISTGPFGSMLHKSDYVNKGIPLVNPMNIVERKIVPSDKMMVSEKTKSRLSPYILHEGMIVMGRRGEMGRCAIINREEDGWLCGTGSFFMKPSSFLFVQYIALLLSTTYAKTYLGGQSIGMTMSNLNHKILARMPVPLPPLAEQKRIVAKLEELLPLCEG